jgi:hypothetical protein
MDGDAVKEKIMHWVMDIRQFTVFSTAADETADVARTEPRSFIVRSTALRRLPRRHVQYTSPA